MANTFKCYECNGVFEKGWSDEEMLAEAALNFPEELNAESDLEDSLVCDDCYKALFPTSGNA